jgi:RNA polymerase sigma-70 factor (ECF subfamily)
MAADGMSGDARLAQRFREGDEEAFRLLCDRYTPVLEGRVRRLLPTRLTRKLSVADILQEARLVAFRRRADFVYRGPASWRNWLFGIVELKVREALRRYVVADKRAAQREVSRGHRADTAHFEARQPSPSQAAVAAELEARVRKALAELSPDDREVLRLAREEQLSLAEVAAHMGRSREAVKKLYGRALCRFREHLNWDGGKQ